LFGLCTDLSSFFFLKFSFLHQNHHERRPPSFCQKTLCGSQKRPPLGDQRQPLWVAVFQDSSGLNKAAATATGGPYEPPGAVMGRGRRVRPLLVWRWRCCTQRRLRLWRLPDYSWRKNGKHILLVVSQDGFHGKTLQVFFFFFFFLNALAVKHETCTLTLISKANSSLLFRVVFAVLQVSGQNFIYGKFPRFNQRRINQNLIQDRPVVFVHGSLSRSVILWKNLWFSQ
jgi:hypothetical protein